MTKGSCYSLGWHKCSFWHTRVPADHEWFLLQFKLINWSFFTLWVVPANHGGFLLVVMFSHCLFNTWEKSSCWPGRVPATVEVDKFVISYILKGSCWPWWVPATVFVYKMPIKHMRKKSLLTRKGSCYSWSRYFGPSLHYQWFLLTMMGSCYSFFWQIAYSTHEKKVPAD